MPKIATDDLLLFGSLAMTAIGAALVVGVISTEPMLAIGIAFITFGLPSALITFMAAFEESK